MILRLFTSLLRREQWNKLAEQLRQVNADIKSKQKCLELDKRALETRERLGELLGRVLENEDADEKLENIANGKIVLPK